MREWSRDGPWGRESEELSSFPPVLCPDATGKQPQERHMHGLIYLIGLIVVILAILSFFGLR
jgi:hypothetical protein